jgi:nucleoid-associated protein YgaU
LLVLGSGGSRAGAQELHSPAAQVAGTSYTVKAGDNLSSIALRAYGNTASWVAIWNANNWIVNPNYLLPGWVITLPAASSGGGAPSGIAGTTYTVQRGDSLSSIAYRAYGNASSWACIWAANSWIVNPNYLQAGWRIMVPASGACGGGTPATPRYHTVRAGETLSGIACYYYSDCNYSRIYDANRDKIWNVHFLVTGWVLRIP